MIKKIARELYLLDGGDWWYWDRLPCIQKPYIEKAQRVLSVIERSE